MKILAIFQIANCIICLIFSKSAKFKDFKCHGLKQGGKAPCLNSRRACVPMVTIAIAMNNSSSHLTNSYHITLSIATYKALQYSLLVFLVIKAWQIKTQTIMAFTTLHV